MAACSPCPCGAALPPPGQPTGPPARCPACGRVLARPAGASFRKLAPRLTLSALAALLVVSAFGYLLVRSLPPRGAPESDLVGWAAGEAEGSPPSPPADTPGRAPPPGVREGVPAPVRGLPPFDPSPGRGGGAVPPLGKERPGAAGPAPGAGGGAVPGLKPGDAFYQEVVVGRVSRYRALGADLGQDVRYALVSRFRVERRTPGGGLVLRQRVRGVRLTRADRALQEHLNGLLAKVRGSSFTITLDGKGRVRGFDGADEALKVLTAPGPPGGQAFLLWSFLDRDGWKELAQRSLFRPPGPPRPGQSWAEPMTHSWGPLGLWSGRAVHRYAGRKGGLEHYRYALELAYRPPPAGARGLPFLIERPDFRVQSAAGEVAFDPARGRVAAFEEGFHVRGSLAVSALGVLTPVALDERQVFRVRILDEDPLRGPARR